MILLGLLRIRGGHVYLADTDVITGRDYLAEAGQHFTPWSKRMLARVGSVWTRLDLEQIYPGSVQRRPDWQGVELYEFGAVDAASLVHCAEQINASEPLIQARALKCRMTFPSSVCGFTPSLGTSVATIVSWPSRDSRRTM